MRNTGDAEGDRRRALSPLLETEDFRPLSALVQVEIAARSRRGTLRLQNQAHYLAVRLGRFQETLITSLPAADLPPRFEENGYVMVLADGVGGGDASAVASRVAISSLAHLALHYGKWNFRIDGRTAAEIAQRTEYFYQRVHEAVVERSERTPALGGITTTLTAAYSAGDDLFIAHVGHSRAYSFRDGDLTQLTIDQTLERRLSEGSGPVPIESSTRNLQQILTDAIGGRAGSPEVEVEHFRLWHGDRILLCTSGLTEVVDDDTIADVLTARRRPEETCQTLVDLAFERGSQDEVTVLLADYRLPPPRT